MAIVREIKMSLSDVQANNNKFWHGTLTDSSEVILEWGRIGDTLQSKTKSFGSQYQAEAFFEDKIKEKKKKGYSELQIFGTGVTGTIVVNHDKSSLKEIAKSQIVSDDETKKLIEKLTDANIHNILSSTTLTFSNDTGLFATPLGIVTDNSIREARHKLNQMSSFVDKRDFNNTDYIDLLNQYLRLIPQKVGRKLHSDIYPDLGAIKSQNDILDSLEVSFQQSISGMNDQKEQKKIDAPQVFSCEITSMLDKDIIERIDKKYRSTLQSMHSSSSLKVRKVYNIKIEKQYREFKEVGSKVGNIQELWHGTKTANLLSILKSGLIVPPKGNPNVTGRMFGDGLYFSDQSTKALNYSNGYWGGGRDNNCYMFLADVAMGSSYTPRSYSESLPKSGYNSTFAKANFSGVMNNEMIVYHTNQVSLKYLVEFSN